MKTKLNNTPGPWVVDPNCDSIIGTVYDDKNGFLHVADVRGWGRFQYKGEDGEREYLANGRLLAAAPEMLRKLMAVSEILKEQGGQGGLDGVAGSIDDLVDEIVNGKKK